MGAWRRLHTRAGRAFVNVSSYDAYTARVTRNCSQLQYPCSTKSGPVASGDDCDGDCRDASRPSRHGAHALLNLRARHKTAPAANSGRIDCYSLQKRTCRTTVSLLPLVVQKNQRFAAHRQRKHSIFLQQLQPSCSVPRLRTRVPQRRRITANNPTRLTHDDARRAPHVQRDEAAHAFRD